MRVAVIGTGPAGLSAAHTLVQSGASVTVLERESRAGGKLRTEQVGGAAADVGVQLVSSTYTAFASLLRACGAGDVLKRSPGRDALWRKESAHAITYGSIASMVTSSALPTALKLQLGTRYLPFLKTAARSLDANEPAATGGASLDTESIAEWGRRELSDDFVELLVYPLLAAYYGSAPEDTSAAVYHALARVGMEVTVHAAAGGFGAAASAIASSLTARGVDLRVGFGVTGIREDGDAVRIDSGDVSELFDAAVLAVPASAAAALLRDHSPDVAEWLRGVEVTRALTVALRVDRPFPGDYFGLSFPRRSDIGRVLAALCIESRKLRGFVPSGDVLVALPAPGAAAALYDRTDADVVGDVLGTLERAVRGVSRRVTHAHVQRYEQGYTIFRPGHVRALDRAPMLGGRIALAGDYLVAPSVEGAVRSGARAAARITAG